MQTTAYYGLKKPEPTIDNVDITVESDNMDIIDGQLKKHANGIVYETAGGTGTAITLSNVTLENGHPKTFIASANNSGNDTTINGKHLYKPGTTTSPTLISGKAYEVWYNLSGDCFFIKASATGTAGVGDVLAPCTFSTENDTDLVGTLTLTGTAGDANVLYGQTYYNTDAKTKRTGSMANNGAINVTQTTSGQVTTIPAGYHNGSGQVTNNITIESLGGKKVANGSITVASDGTVSVSGLPFTPSLIIVKYANSDNHARAVYHPASNNTLGSTSQTQDGTLTTTWGSTPSSSSFTIPWTVNGGSFTTSCGTVSFENTTAYWWAYE